MNKLEDLLHMLGVTPNYKCYRQTLLATSLAVQQPDSLLLVTKRLYPAVAREHRTTWHAVERNIRLAVNIAWRCNPGLLSALAGYQLEENPTAALFIAIFPTGVMQPVGRLNIRVPWLCGSGGVAPHRTVVLSGPPRVM